MKRKVVRQGAATLMVSLPSKWAHKVHLKKGDEVDVEEENNNIVITAGKPLGKKREITVEITETNKEDIQVILTHLYRRGFDKIKLKGVSGLLINTITSVTKDLLLGFEVTERDGKLLTVTNISEPTEEQYNVLLRRVFLIIKETQNIVRKDFETGRFDRLKEVEELRKQQDKFILFCRRIVTREHEFDSVIKWELLTFLMHIQHSYYYLYKYAAENKVKKNEHIVELLKDLENYFQLYYDAFFSKDLDLIHKINKLKKNYQFGVCYAYLEQAKGKEAVVLSQIRELFRLIQVGASPILSGLFQASFG